MKAVDSENSASSPDCGSEVVFLDQTSVRWTECSYCAHIQSCVEHPLLVGTLEDPVPLGVGALLDQTFQFVFLKKKSSLHALGLLCKPNQYVGTIKECASKP